MRWTDLKTMVVEGQRVNMRCYKTKEITKKLENQALKHHRFSSAHIDQMGTCCSSHELGLINRTDVGGDPFGEPVLTHGR